MLVKIKPRPFCRGEAEWFKEIGGFKVRVFAKETPSAF